MSKVQPGANLTTGVAIGASAPRTLDPREDDPTREGIFRSHNCWRCSHGARPCARGAANRCEYPHARND